MSVFALFVRKWRAMRGVFSLFNWAHGKMTSTVAVKVSGGTSPTATAKKPYVYTDLSFFLTITANINNITVNNKSLDAFNFFFLSLNLIPSTVVGGYEYAMRPRSLRKACWAEECFLQHFLRLRREFSADLRESSSVRGCLKWQAGRGVGVGWGGALTLQQHSPSLPGVNAASPLSKENNSVFDAGHKEELFTQETVELKQAQPMREHTSSTCKCNDFRFKVICKLLCSSINKWEPERIWRAISTQHYHAVYSHHSLCVKCIHPFALSAAGSVSSRLFYFFFFPFLFFFFPLSLFLNTCSGFMAVGDWPLTVCQKGKEIRIWQIDGQLVGVNGQISAVWVMDGNFLCCCDETSH